MDGESEVVTAPDSEHTRLRRVLAPAFLDKAIRDQEALILANVDLLAKRLKVLAHSSETKGNADLSMWLNWATFDITGDLAFGEPFGCLEAGKYRFGWHWCSTPYGLCPSWAPSNSFPGWTLFSSHSWAA